MVDGGSHDQKKTVSAVHVHSTIQYLPNVSSVYSVLIPKSLYAKLNLLFFIFFRNLNSMQHLRLSLFS